MASLPIVVKYLIVFLISMVPIVELRGAIPIAESLKLSISLYYPIAIIGNMLPVPIIYLFATLKIKWLENQKCYWHNQNYRPSGNLRESRRSSYHLAEPPSQTYLDLTLL